MEREGLKLPHDGTTAYKVQTSLQIFTKFGVKAKPVEASKSCITKYEIWCEETQQTHEYLYFFRKYSSELRDTNTKVSEVRSMDDYSVLVL
jgi:hypothetical protein